MAGVEFEQTDLPPFVDAANAARVGLQDHELIDNALLPVSLIKHDLAHCCEKGGGQLLESLLSPLSLMVFTNGSCCGGFNHWRY